MNSMNLILCAAAAAALDICILVLIIASYCEKRSAKKSWDKTSHGMELAEHGMTYPLGCDETLIGRHASADIRLPDLSVSRYHAILTVSGGVWTITDLGSKSGLFINGSLVHEAVLRENDQITIGNRRLIFRKRRNDRVR